MTNTRSKPGTGPLTESEPVRETFADEAVGIALINGNCHITLAVQRADHGANRDPAPITRHVAGRIVLPLSGVIGLWQTLGNFIAELEAKGLVAKAPDEPVTLQ